MGTFVTAIEVKSKATVDTLSEMDLDDIEDLYIFPAEATLEERFALKLDTDGYPGHLSGFFEQTSQRAVRNRERFFADMKKALFLLINRMAVNPHGFASERAGRSSQEYGYRIPPEVTTIMQRWKGKGQRRLIR